MNQKLDPELLLQNMLALPEKGKTPVPEDLRYLMDTVVTPLLNDETVPLAVLDYDRFDEMDLDSLEEYIKNAVDRDSRLWLLESELDRLPPLCVSCPVFC